MLFESSEKLTSGVYITFSGNCKRALTFYQSCFGGTIDFEIFETPLEGFSEMPVINGSLVSDSIVIHGSDLVHNEGRRIGNYLSVFLPCKSVEHRRAVAEKLHSGQSRNSTEDEKLMEVVDKFDVRWVLSITN